MKATKCDLCAGIPGGPACVRAARMTPFRVSTLETSLVKAAVFMQNVLYRLLAPTVISVIAFFGVYFWQSQAALELENPKSSPVGRWLW